MPPWPSDVTELLEFQERLAAMRPGPWTPPRAPAVGGCFVCFDRACGVKGFAAAAVVQQGRVLATALASGETRHPYEPGLLALREGALLEAAVRALPCSPDVLLVNATGLDHPRGAGLASHLGFVLAVPTVGVTDRPLCAVPVGDPGPARGDFAPLVLAGKEVGRLVRTRPGARPVAVHAAWRTTPETAMAIVLGLRGHHRTPEPLRRARAAARSARASG